LDWGGSIICPGVVIGEGVVVAAGSIVTKNCDANSLYAGNPARKIKELNLSCNNENS
jgi:maltose O-acetyltransferase